MQGWKIFKHSFTQIFANLAAAVRISAVLFLVSIVASQFWVNSVGDSMYDGTWVTNGGVWGLYSLMMIVSTIVGLWIAVAWHRFILTGEIADGWFPKLHIARMWSYFLRGLLVFIVCVFPVSIVLGIALAILGALFSNSSALVGLAWLVPVLVMIPIFVISIRISTILPAAALGKALSLREAWRSTKGSTGAIIVIVLIFGLLYTPAILLQPLIIASSAFSFIWNITFGWVMTMLGISLLTTFYGHYVEGRALND